MLKRGTGLDFWVYAFWVALPCLLFWPALFEGRLIFGYDTLAFGVPFDAALRACLDARQWPLWLNGVNGGMPGVAACNLAFAYPTDFFAGLAGVALPLRLGLDASIHLALSGLGLYALLRRLSLRRSACLLGAVFFALSGSETSQLQGGYYNFVEGVAWLPWAFWAAHKARHEGSRFAWGLCGAAFALQVLAGAAQLCFCTILAVACFTLAPGWGPADGPGGTRVRGRAGRSPGRTLPGLALALAFCSTLAAPQLWPTLRYLPLSARHGYAAGALAQGSLSPAEALTWIVPGCLGWSGATYHGSLNLCFTSGYFGLLPWALALAALAANGLRDSRTRWWCGLALAAFFFAQRGWAPFLPLFQRLPLLSGFREWHRLLFLATFAVCVLAALGWQALLDPERAPKARRGALVFWLLAALGAACAWRLAVARAEASAPLMPWVDPDPGRAAALLLAQARASLLVSSGLIVLGLGLTLWAERGVARALPLALALALAFHGLDWGLNLSRFVRFEDPASAVARPAYADPPPAPPGLEPWRILDADERGPNRDMLYGYENLGGQESMPMRSYLQTQAALQSVPWGWRRWLDLMGVRAVFRHSRPQAYLAGDRVSVQKNKGAYPRAWLVGQSRSVPNEAAAYRLLADSGFNPRLEAALPVDLGLRGGPERGSVRWLQRRPLAFSLDVVSDRPAALVVSNFWYPEWKAAVDGQKTPILKADGALQAVAIPEGEHRVDFHYDEGLFNAALAACLAGLVLLLGLGWMEHGRRR